MTKAFFRKYFCKEKLLQFFVSLLLFVLPWQTIYITQEQFLNGAKWQYGTLGFFATEILLWCCITIFVIQFIRDRKLFGAQSKINFHWSKDRIFVFSVLLFILYSFSSILWSLDKQVSLQHAFHILEMLLLFLILFLGNYDTKTLIRCFVAGAVLQSVLGIYQFLSQSTVALKWLGLALHPVMEAGTSVIVGDDIGRVMRAYGAFSHPNVFGGYLAIAIIFTTLFILKEYKKQFSYKIFQITCFALQLVALFFTFSRSAWIATIVFFLGLFVFFVRGKHVGASVIANEMKQSLRSVLKIIFVTASILTVTYWPLIHTRIAHQSSHEIQSTQERTQGYKEAVQIWKTSPWVGVGSGNYTAAAYTQQIHRPGWEYQPVHNVPLLFLTEFGMVGIVLLLGILVSFYRFQRVFRENKIDELENFFYYGIFLLPYFFLLLFDHYFYSSYIGLLLSGIYLALIFRFSPSRE